MPRRNRRHSQKLLELSRAAFAPLRGAPRRGLSDAQGAQAGGAVELDHQAQRDMAADAAQPADGGASGHGPTVAQNASQVPPNKRRGPAGGTEGAQ